MKNKKPFAVLILLTPLILSAGIIAVGQHVSAACSWPTHNCGYFYSGTIITDSNGGNRVIRNGVDASSKDEFINYILELLNGTKGDGSGDKVGAAYIIQTMRGTDNNGGSWDKENPPSTSDIQNWKDLIDSPDIAVNFNYDFSYTTNTRRDVSSPYDVSRYGESDTQKDPAIVFYKSGGSETDPYYVVKRACGNPLGALPGLPALNYKLTPTVNLKTTGLIEPGVSARFIPKVTNSSPVSGTGDTDSQGTYWELNSFQYPASNVPPSGGSSVLSTKPCNYYPGITNCSKLSSGSNKIFKADLTSNIVTSPSSGYYTDSSTGSLPIGTRICYAVSVHSRIVNNGVEDTGWQNSNAECLVIGKKPKVQIWGGDLLAGGAVTTSYSKIGVNTFGSWVEYAIFAKGVITSSTSSTNTASGSAFAGAGQANSTVALSSNLSFANSGNLKNCLPGSLDSNTVGCYAIPPAPNIAASFPVTGSVLSGTVLPQSLVSNTYGAIDLTLGSATSVLSSGKSVIINATGTVKITNDQKYSNGPYSNSKELPQLVIIANNIDIADNVTQIDAWLIASGSINTCASVGGTNLSVSANLSSSICKDKLVVNGPVAANKIYLRRTAGSEDKARIGNAAEQFNLRADAYLWAYSRVTGNGRIETMHTTELPPRL